MASLSVRDLELLGYVDVREESDTPRWSIFTGAAVAGLERVPATFVYLKSDAKNEDATRAMAATTAPGQHYVVIPRSDAKRGPRIEQLLEGKAKVYLHEDLVWRQILHTFSDYLSALATNIPQEPNYVAPRAESGDPKVRLDDTLVRILTNPATEGQVHVVRAPAGVGKTTLARAITKKLADGAGRNSLIPVHVESSHWGRLQLSSVEEIWDIIDNSLRMFSPNIRINRVLFEHLVRQGSLAFVFDGFDELCGQRHTPFSAKEVLEELRTLAQKSSARILLTTRTLYWDSEVGSAPPDVNVVDLASFNKQQALGYFASVFRRSVKKREQASSLYAALVASNVPPTHGGSRAQFVNHPVCVQMIAQCVDLRPEERLAIDSQKSLVYQFLRQLCDREIARQSLITRTNAQLEAFEQLAVDQAGQRPAKFELEMCEAAGFNQRDIQKLTDHPLLNRLPESTERGNVYTFRYEFLAEYFRARHLARVIRSLGESDADAPNNHVSWDLMALEANGKGNVIEHLLGMLEPEDLSAVGRTFRRTAGGIVAERARSFLFHVARLLTDLTSLTRRERTDRLFETLGGDPYRRNRSISGLYVIGQLDRLDLSGVTVEACTFIDATFRDCSADGGTVFRGCTFSGHLEFASGDRRVWGAVKAENCIMEFPANLAWEEVAGVPVDSKEEHVKDALRLALGKFWRHGQPKLSIQKADWARGTFGHSVYCRPILERLLHHGVLQRITISGVSEGGLLLSKEALGDLQRFMDNRQLTGPLRQVYRELVED